MKATEMNVTETATNNISSSTVVMPEGQESTNTSTLSNYVKMAVASLFLVSVSPTFTSCEKDEISKEGLTADQQRFADLLKPNADGKPKSISIDIGDPSSPFYMPKLFKIEMTLIDAKAGTYEITPYISKEPIANALSNAQEIDPSANGPVAGIGLVVKNENGNEFSPTSTNNIRLKDDNDPLTLSPFIDQLPDVFRLDEFNKYISPSSQRIKESIILNKTDELQFWIEIKGINKKFESIKLPIKPVEISALQNSGN